MKVTNEIEIEATPEEVFYWLEDPDRARECMTSVKHGEIIKETPNKIGTTFCETIEEDDRALEMRGVVTEFVSNKRFAVHLESDLNSFDVGFNLNPKADGTHLTQSVELRFKGMLKLLTLFSRVSIRRKIESQARREFARLNGTCQQL
jgi:carbon monoxide dehydrogenase subunit G